jgi:hypothetical protein
MVGFKPTNVFLQITPLTEQPLKWVVGVNLSNIVSLYNTPMGF